MNIFELFKTIEKPRSTGPVEWIVAGLGNPGREYEKTRHNVGFLAIDYLCQKVGVPADHIKFHGVMADLMLDGVRMLAIKPQTYMNNSGECLRETAAFYKIPPERVLVIYDDTTLAPGRLRIRRQGSDGGHNGMKSILYHLRTNEFPRIRVGIGQKPSPEYDLADWVLSRFDPLEEKDIMASLDKVYEAVRLIVAGDTQQAMNLYNG